MHTGKSGGQQTNCFFIPPHRSSRNLILQFLFKHSSQIQVHGYRSRFTDVTLLFFVALVTWSSWVGSFIIPLSSAQHAGPYPTHVIVSGRKFSLMKNVKKCFISLDFYLDHDLMLNYETQMDLTQLYAIRYSVTWSIILYILDINWPGNVIRLSS